MHSIKYQGSFKIYIKVFHTERPYRYHSMPDCEQEQILSSNQIKDSFNRVRIKSRFDSELYQHYKCFNQHVVDMTYIYTYSP